MWHLCWHPNAHIKLEKAWDTHALLWLLKSSILDYMWPHFYIIARLTWPVISSSSASLGNAGMRDCIWRGVRLDQGEQMSWIFLGRAITGKDAWSALSPQTWNFLSGPAWRQKRLWHETWELIADKPTKLEMKAHLAVPWKDAFMKTRSLIFDHICLQRCEHSCRTLNSQSPSLQQVMTGFPVPIVSESCFPSSDCLDWKPKTTSISSSHVNHLKFKATTIDASAGKRDEAFLQKPPLLPRTVPLCKFEQKREAVKLSGNFKVPTVVVNLLVNASRNSTSTKWEHLWID